MSDSAWLLPARPSLGQLQKQAKELLKQYCAGESAALERFQKASPRLATPGYQQLVTLADAQFVLAREYGFESWAKLKHQVELMRAPVLKQYKQLANDLAAAYTSGDSMAIREVNWNFGTSFAWDHEPLEMQRRLTTWFASGTRTPDLALADAQRMVAHSYGFESWAEFVESTTKPADDPGHAPVFTNSRPPFYKIDWKDNRLSARGPLSEQDWDTIFGVIKDHRITKLRAAGMIDAAMKRLPQLDHVTHLHIGDS